jgi:hypothetical protein
MAHALQPEVIQSPRLRRSLVVKGTDHHRQWLRESLRFFPLVGMRLDLVIHPFGLATNKVLALAGQLEPRG